MTLAVLHIREAKRNTPMVVKSALQMKKNLSSIVAKNCCKYSLNKEKENALQVDKRQPMTNDLDVSYRNVFFFLLYPQKTGILWNHQQTLPFHFSIHFSEVAQKNI